MVDITLIHEDVSQVAHYNAALGIKHLKFVSGGRSRLMDAVFDAIFLPLTFAEEFGSRPIRNQAQVLSTNGKPGWPRYVVTGVALSHDAAMVPLEATTVTLRAIVQAVNSFNSNAKNIATLGIYLPDVGSNRLEPAILQSAIRDQLMGLAV